MVDLFGRYCYIDTPWIAGKRTRYRILGSDVKSNAWCEVPVNGRTELIHHDYMEEVVFVVLDTLVSDDSIIRRFALKDVDVIPADVRPVVRGEWLNEDSASNYLAFKCSVCGTGGRLYKFPFCSQCGADMRGGGEDG